MGIKVEGMKLTGEWLNKSKIPHHMEVEPCYKLLTLLTWRTLSTWFIGRYGVSEENVDVERSEVDTPFRLL